MFGYRISGLAVSSELPLAGAIQLERVPGNPDVQIRRRPVPDTLAGARKAGPNWQIAEHAFLLCVPGIARLLLREGRAIDVDVADGAAPEDAAVFLTGSAFGILLHQRSRLVLHASAIAVNGKAMLFCGPSGAGKSTLAAALVSAGYPLLSDDVTAIEQSHGVPQVHSDGRKLKLWDNAVRRLDLDASRGARVRAALEKYYVEPAARHEAALPLGAVYLLGEDRPPHSFGIARPVLSDAAVLLRANAYRPRLVREMRQQIEYLNAAVAISKCGGIFRLFRPLRFEALPDVIALLRDHWVEIASE